MRVRILATAITAALVAATAAYAAGMFGGVPSVPAAQALTGAELSPADTGLSGGQAPQTELISTQQYRAAAYVQATPTTGTTVAALGPTQLVQLTPAGTLATLTVTMPPTPVDGQRFRIFTTQTLTALTITAGSGQTINGTAVTTLSANTAVSYIYNGTNSTWYRES